MIHEATAWTELQRIVCPIIEKNHGHFYLNQSMEQRKLTQQRFYWIYQQTPSIMSGSKQCVFKCEEYINIMPRIFQLWLWDLLISPVKSFVCLFSLFPQWLICLKYSGFPPPVEQKWHFEWLMNSCGYIQRLVHGYVITFHRFLWDIVIPHPCLNP